MLARSPGAARSLLCAGLFVLCLLALAAGCGPDYKARAIVRGKVRLGKTPLNFGTVTFYGPHNIVASAPIDENGNYEMKDAPIGDVKVTVAVNPPMGGGGAGGGMVAPGLKGMGGGGSKAEAEAWKKAAGKIESKDPTGENPGIGLMPKIPANIVRIDGKYATPETSGLTYKVEKGEHTHDIDL